MFPRKKLATKRKPTPPPSIDRERLTREFALKEIAFERRFPVEDYVEREECKWTLAFLERNGYSMLLEPFDTELYPRLVKLFYQNLQFGKGERGIDYFTFSIDGYSRTIMIEDMARITRMPARFEQERTPHLRAPYRLPAGTDIYDYIRDNFTAGVKQGKGESLILSSLPEGLWFLDRIIRENVFPLGHNSERRQEVLHFLHASHYGCFYSLPYLYMRGITKMAEELRNRSRAGKTRALPYGFLISSILRYADYPFDPEEPELPVEVDIPLSAWTTSYRRLYLASRKRGDEDERGEPSTRAESPTTARSPSRPSTSTTDPAVLERLSRLETQYRRLRREHRETDKVIRALARHGLGADYQSQIDDFEEEEARRGKAAAEAATAEDEEGSTSDYEDEEAEEESD